jgi:hypothetical protein
MCRACGLTRGDRHGLLSGGRNEQGTPHAHGGNRLGVFSPPLALCYTTWRRNAVYARPSKMEIAMRLSTSGLIAILALSSACTSPSTPSPTRHLYELRIAESPICKTLTGLGPSREMNVKYGYFQFGQSVVHVSGRQGLMGAYVLEDDSLAQTTTCGQRLTLTIDSHDTNGAVTGSVAPGRWFPSGCPGGYLDAEGTITGIASATSGSGLLNGTLGNGIWAYNFSGTCPATDHSWSLTTVQ